MASKEGTVPVSSRSVTMRVARSGSRSVARMSPTPGCRRHSRANGPANRPAPTRPSENIRLLMSWTKTTGRGRRTRRHHARTRSSSTPDQSARTGTGVGTVHQDRYPRFDHLQIPVDALHEPAPSGREVVHSFRAMESERGEVDDVQVGDHSFLDRATVAETVGAGGVAAELAHEGLHWDPFATRSITSPVGEHEGGHARIRDDATVRTAVREPEDEVLARDGPLEIVEPVSVVEPEWLVEELGSTLRDQQVEHHLERIAMASRGDPGDTLLPGRLVVGNGAEREDRPEHGSGVVTQRPVRRRLGENARFELRLRHQRNALGERQRRDLLVGRIPSE